MQLHIALLIPDSLSPSLVTNKRVGKPDTENLGDGMSLAVASNLAIRISSESCHKQAGRQAGVTAPVRGRLGGGPGGQKVRQRKQQEEAGWRFVHA